MDIVANEQMPSETPARFTRTQIASIAVRVGVVVAAVGTIAYISHKRKHSTDTSN